MSDTGWIYLKLGDRRPDGDVLVARRYGRDPEDKLLAAIFGDEVNERTTVTVAHWHKGRQKWIHGPRGEEVRAVYAWMPLPPPPQQETTR